MLERMCKECWEGVWALWIECGDIAERVCRECGESVGIVWVQCGEIV